MSIELQSTTLPAIAAIAGGAILVILQFLRARPPRRTVATVMFWRQARKEQDRRVLWGQFSQWRSFLLLLAGILLLSAALTGALWTSQAQRGQPVVAVIDTGLSMGARDGSGQQRLAQALELVRKDLASAGARPVAILESGSMPRLLSPPDAPRARAAVLALLGQAAATTRPAASAGALITAAELLASQSGRICWYTDRARLPDGLPAGVRDHVELRSIGAGAANQAILDVIFEPGAPEAMDGNLRVRVGAWGAGPVGARLSTTVSGAAIEATGTPIQEGISDVMFPGVAADGSQRLIELTHGGAILDDDRVVVRLPRRVPLAAQIGPDVPPALRQAISAICTGKPANGATIQVLAGVPAPAGQASIQVIGGNQRVGGMEQVTVAAAGSLTTGLSFEAAVCGHGADLADATPGLHPVLLAGGHVLAAAAMDGPSPRLVLSDAVFAPGSNIPERAAFLILLQRACRELGGWSAVPLVLPPERNIIDPMWASDADGNEVPQIMPGDRAASDPSGAPSAAQALDLPGAGFPLEPWQLALLGALGLLLIESVLHARGRVV